MGELRSGFHPQSDKSRYQDRQHLRHRSIERYLVVVHGPSGAHASFNLFEPLESDQYTKDLANVLRDRPDFRMHRIALGDEETTLQLHLYREHVGSTLIDQDWEGVVAKQAVPVRRLDDVVSTLALPSSHL